MAAAAEARLTFPCWSSIRPLKGTNEKNEEIMEGVGKPFSSFTNLDYQDGGVHYYSLSGMKEKMRQDQDKIRAAVKRGDERYHWTDPNNDPVDDGHGNRVNIETEQLAASREYEGYLRELAELMWPTERPSPVDTCINAAWHSSDLKLIFQEGNFKTWLSLVTLDLYVNALLRGMDPKKPWTPDNKGKGTFYPDQAMAALRRSLYDQVTSVRLETWMEIKMKAWLEEPDQ